MKAYSTITSLPETAQDHVIVIGNFDGVHRGHQGLLAEARKVAQAHDKKLGVLTFEPHPRHLFRPDDPPFRLTTPETKFERLMTCGIDTLVTLNFDWDFASQTPDQFIDRVLRRGLRAAHIVVGNDFCFGQLRKGNAQTLTDAGLNVTILKKFSDDDDGVVFSSSAVRQALRSGDMDTANDLLGWPWEIRGVIQVGDRRGRELGYPTANLRLGDLLHPAYGIYATFVQIIEDGPDAPWLPSATNIGIRPMFALSEGQVEAHIFDFDRDIYGKTLRVRPVRRLRGEAKFESLEALITQIGLDCEEARKLLRRPLSQDLWQESVFD